MDFLGAHDCTLDLRKGHVMVPNTLHLLHEDVRVEACDVKAAACIPPGHAAVIEGVLRSACWKVGCLAVAESISHFSKQKSA